LLGQLTDSGNGSKTPGSFELLTFASGLAGAALKDKPRSLGVVIAGFTPETESAVAEALLLAVAAHNFVMPAFKGKKSPAPRLRTVRIAGASRKLDFKRTLAEAEGLNLARWLTALPPNKLDATAYRQAVSKLAEANGWQMEFLDTRKLTKAGAGAFLAVAQGNASDDAGIVHLRYRPGSSKKTSAPALALVGKGIIFDTGGNNLKNFQQMLDMHCDMSGSAVALATLQVLTQLEFDQPVDCWLAITENRISATAYKSRDIVTASNGTTIEIIHTDAEGRMALADTLALAGNEKPAAIIDFATLTGSCVAALTDRYSGLLTNRAELNNLLIDAGQRSGERVWPFPMDDDFGDAIKSKVADVLQCAVSGGGDHIQAAKFLQRFVPKKSTWVHIDLSAATRKGGLAQVPTEVTGFGVRYATALILDNLEELTRRK
jgi:leucyl aminopeptidase